MSNDTTRNPFGVMDVPEPNDADVIVFAATAVLDGSQQDANADIWDGDAPRTSSQSINGAWSSRWNGGADPAVPGDAPERWKAGAPRRGPSGSASTSGSTGTAACGAD